MPRMLGYGLAKMGEGISSGMLRGTMYNNQMKAEKQKRDQDLVMEIAKMAQSAQQHAETVGVQQAGVTAREKATAATQQTEKDKLAAAERRFKITQYGTALKAAVDALATTDEKTANEILNAWGKNDPDWPFKGLTLDKQDKSIQVKGGNGTWVVRDQSVLGDLAKIMAESPDNFQEVVAEARRLKIANFIPMAGASMSVGEGERLKREDTRIDLEKKKIKIAERKEIRESGQQKIDTESKVRDRITEIEKARANLRAKGISQEQLNMFDEKDRPLMMSLMGNKLSPDDLAKVEKVMDDEIASLTDKYLPKGTPASTSIEKRKPGETVEQYLKRTGRQ